MTWLHAGLTPEGEAIPDMADPSCGTEEAPFQAVLVFSDPIDWYRDLQLITDVIMSGQHDMSRCMYGSSSLMSSCQVGTICPSACHSHGVLLCAQSVLWLLGAALAHEPALQAAVLQLLWFPIHTFTFT